VPRTGRRPGDPATRERIAAAASELFAERGLDATSIRAIAASAEVDPSLVLHYFGSKQALFVAVTKIPFDLDALAAIIDLGDTSTVGERMVRFALGAWDDPGSRPAFLGILRSAVTDASAAALLRDVITQGPVAIIRQLGVSDAELRAELVGSHLIGLMMARHVLRVEPIANADPETIVAIVAPTIQRYIMGELPGSPATFKAHRGPAPRRPRGDQAPRGRREGKPGR
jgi:AcrR family transcriptional regulator